MKHHALTISLLFLPIAHAHEHRAVGFLDMAPENGLPDAGEPLRIIGPDGTGTIHHLRPRALGPQPRPEEYHPEWRGGGYYYLDERPRQIYDAAGNPALDNQNEPIIADEGFSLVALSSDPDFPEAGHALPGSWIWCEILSVTGPEGAHFGFWDAQRSYYFDTPTYLLPVNQPTGSPRFVISEGADQADADPYGHIHHRAWTADKPGDYFLTIRFVDLSTNRPGGVPWHAPSASYVYHFRAGPDFTPTGQHVPGAGYVLTWPSQMGISPNAYPEESGMVFRILRGTTLAPADWTVVGEVTAGATATATFTDPSPPAGKAFYRLAYDWNTP